MRSAVRFCCKPFEASVGRCRSSGLWSGRRRLARGLFAEALAGVAPEPVSDAPPVFGASAAARPEERVEAAIALALEAALPAMIREITEKGFDSLRSISLELCPDNTFDVVSKIELPEVSNAVQQALKEIQQRYDLKDSKSTIELNEKDHKLLLQSQDEFKLKAILDILQQKLVKYPPACL